MKISKKQTYSGKANYLKTASIKIGLAAYGFIANDQYGKQYRIEVALPFSPRATVTVYKGPTKPLFRQLCLISLGWLPAYMLIGIIAFVGVSITLLFGLFYYQTLFRQSFISTRWEYASGYFSLCLYIIGLITLVRWLF